MGPFQTFAPPRTHFYWLMELKAQYQSSSLHPPQYIYIYIIGSKINIFSKNIKFLYVETKPMDSNSYSITMPSIPSNKNYYF